MNAWADCAACGGRDTYLDLEDEEYRLRCGDCGELTEGTADPTGLDTLARTLEALPCVIDASTHHDLCEWVEVAIEGIGVPPEVQSEFVRAGVSIIDVSDQAGTFTVAQVRR